MNKIVLMGRLTADPQVRDSQGVARYPLAVNRKFKKDGEPTADFIPCVVFGRSAEFTEKYFRKGMQVAISGRIQTGSYTNKDGQKVYTTDVVVEEQEFAESKNSSSAGNGGFTGGNNAPAMQDAGDGFMNIPDGIVCRYTISILVFQLFQSSCFPDYDQHTSFRLFRILVRNRC